MSDVEGTRNNLADMIGDNLVDLRQVAGVLGVSVRSVQRLIAGGALPQPLKVGRSSRLCVSDVRAYLSRLRQEYRRA